MKDNLVSVEDLLNHSKISEDGWTAESSKSSRILIRELENLFFTDLKSNKDLLDL